MYCVCTIIGQFYKLWQLISFIWSTEVWINWRILHTHMPLIKTVKIVEDWPFSVVEAVWRRAQYGGDNGSLRWSQWANNMLNSKYNKCPTYKLPIDLGILISSCRRPLLHTGCAKEIMCEHKDPWPSLSQLLCTCYWHINALTYSIKWSFHKNHIEEYNTMVLLNPPPLPAFLHTLHMLEVLL